MITVSKALQSLRPGAEWSLIGDDLIWLDGVQTQPTQEEIDDEITRLQSEYDDKEYQRNRAENYPLLGDQLDMLWHAIDAGTLNKTSDFYKTIKAVKDAHPKSE